MQILITGEPKSGKSTMLADLVEAISPRKGFITREVVGDGRRTGFVVQDTNTRTAILAQTDTATDIRVGRFYVQPEVLTEFVRTLSPAATDELLYIDEIGEIQLHSEGFKNLVTQYLDAPNDFIGTITSVYKDGFVEHLLTRPDILLFYLTRVSRIETNKCLRSALQNRELFNSLTPKLQRVAVSDANHYLANNSYVSFNKLFNRALGYYLEDKVRVQKINQYLVSGKTSEHIVRYATTDDWSCDCPLSKGREPFAAPADCSHFQAVKLFRSEA